MTETLLRAALSTGNPASNSVDALVADILQRGRKVREARAMYDGDHPSNLTAEMRKMLNLPASEETSELNDNHCPVVVDSMADRLEVLQIEALEGKARPQPTTVFNARPLPGASPSASPSASPTQEWVDDLLYVNRFDAIQTDVHEAAIRDGDTFVMAYYDNDARQVKFSHEEAFDGVEGIIPIYATKADPTPALALKVWCVTSVGGTVADTVRINKYYPNRVERYISVGGTSLAPFTPTGEASNTAPWTMRDGVTPVGVPLVHFRNRGKQFGLSELENAIPLQHVINRNLYSLIAAEELTAFRILVAIGFEMPAGITPGAVINIAKDGMPKEKIASLTAIDGAELTQFLEALRFLKSEIGDVTNTPRLTPNGMGGDNASGEALKQREIGLLGKVKRFQIKAGNSWEDVVRLGHRIQTAYGAEQPPALDRLYCRWANPEIRNHKETVENANLIQPNVDQRTYLEAVAPVYGWDDAKMDEILALKQAEEQQRVDQLGAALPRFDAFSPPPDPSIGQPTDQPTTQPANPVEGAA